MTATVSTIRLAQIGDDRRVPGKLVLRAARAEKLDEVFVVGRTDKGDLWCKSSLNAGQTLWLLEKAKDQILSGNPWSIV